MSYFADIPFCILCSNCKYLEYSKSSSAPFTCNRGVMSTSCAARSDNSGYASTGKVRTENTCDHFEQAGVTDMESPKKSEPVTMGGFVKLVITGLIISFIWAIGIIIYQGIMKHSFSFSGPIVLTFITGIPIGTVVFVILRLLKAPLSNFLEKGGGNITAWIITYISPLGVFYFMAQQFGTSIF